MKILNIAYQTEHKLTAKHVVEEAMTKALVRTCNKCNTPFLKEEGCNKMTCTCGNFQCYVCSSDVVDYTHFDQTGDGSGKGCPLYGDMKQILRNQVAIAQEKTLQALLESGAGLEDEDIRVDKKVTPYIDGLITGTVQAPIPFIQHNFLAQCSNPVYFAESFTIGIALLTTYA